MTKKTMKELNRIEESKYSLISNKNCLVVLDNIRSAHNVGSILRSSDCFGIYKVFMVGITPDISNREVQKTALGAQNTIESEHLDSFEDLKNIINFSDYQLIVVEQTQNSTLLNNFIFNAEQKYIFVFGNEVFGVDDNIISIANCCIEIPQIGSKHSLNVANSASIIFWEYFNQINKF